MNTMITEPSQLQRGDIVFLAYEQQGDIKYQILMLLYAEEILVATDPHYQLEAVATCDGWADGLIGRTPKEAVQKLLESAPIPTRAMQTAFEHAWDREPPRAERTEMPDAYVWGEAWEAAKITASSSKEAAHVRYAERQFCKGVAGRSNPFDGATFQSVIVELMDRTRALLSPHHPARVLLDVLECDTTDKDHCFVMGGFSVTELFTALMNRPDNTKGDAQ